VTRDEVDTVLLTEEEWLRAMNVHLAEIDTDFDDLRGQSVSGQFRSEAHRRASMCIPWHLID